MANSLRASNTTTEITFTLNIAVEDARDEYISWCPELNVYSCGDTPMEAFENITDALKVHLGNLVDSGIISRVFKEKGIVFSVAQPRSKLNTLARRLLLRDRHDTLHHAVRKIGGQRPLVGQQTAVIHRIRVPAG